MNSPRKGKRSQARTKPTVKEIPVAEGKKRTDDPRYGRFPDSPADSTCIHKPIRYFDDGFNCIKCGFFVVKPVEEEKPVEMPAEAPPPKAPEKPKELPNYDKEHKISDKYNILELSRSLFDIGGQKFLKPEGAPGPADRERLKIYNDFIADGYKIIQFAFNQSSNSYIFLFEK